MLLAIRLFFDLRIKIHVFFFQALNECGDPYEKWTVSDLSITLFPVVICDWKLGSVRTELVVLAHGFVLLAEHLSQPVEIRLEKYLIRIIWFSILGLQWPVVRLPFKRLISEMIRTELENLKYDL